MEPGTVIMGRFEIERRVGSGAMGEVFRAMDRQTRGPVAVKIVRGEIEQGVERFLREATTLSRVRHPDVVEYIAHGTAPDGSACLVTEWIDGETLTARLARGGLTVREALLVGRSVGRALGAGHRAGVVHRDVKPGNVMLVGGEASRAKLLDFGIARRTTEGTLTAVGMMLGTPGYMAPEQARGASRVGPPADVFGLGALLYRCLAGRAPFAADSYAGVLAKTLFDEPERLETRCPGAAGEIASAVHAMLCKEASGRPPDGDAAAELLERLVAQVPDEGEAAGVVVSSVPEVPALTQTERRIVTVLFVQPPKAAGEDAPTLVGEPAPVAIMDAERDIAGEHHLRIERLVGGARVLTIAGLGSAKEQALRVTHAALKLARILPGAALGAATGRGEMRGQSAVGEAIERAERLTRTADGNGRLFVDDMTAGFIEDAFELAREGASWQVLGPRLQSTGVRTLLGKPSPCIGRERELGMLVGLADESADERVARAAVVIAPAGYGKSRVRLEWLKRLEQGAVSRRVLLARADPMTAGSPLGMLRQLVAQAMGVHDGDAPDVARARVHASASALFRDADRERVASFTCELIGCAASGASPHGDVMLLGDQMRAAALDVFSALADQQPLVLVLEDLHWGDLPTVRFVSDALRTLEQKPLLVVALARPEVADLFPDLWAERGATVIRLHELTKGAAERLVRHALGAQAEGAVVDRIVARAVGNALFLEELIRHAAEGKHDETPETIRVMMHARLDALEASARRVLRAASIFGQAFWSAGVHTLTDTGDDTVDTGDWLRVLCEREVITRRTSSRFAGQDEYVFGHALVREAAYDMVTDQDRRVGHRLAGIWLEGSGETDGVALGEHFERGGEPGRAAQWFERAAERALAGNDFDATIRLARRAMALYGAAEHGGLQCLIAQASRWKGDHQTALDAALSSRSLARPGSLLWYRALLEVAVESAPLGRNDIVDEVREALLNVHPEPGAEAACAAAISRTATQLLIVTSRPDAARPLLDRLYGTAPDVLARDPATRACVEQSHAYDALSVGDMFEYARRCRLASEAFRAAGDIRGSSTLAANVGYAAMTLGDLEGAERALRQSVASATQMGLRRLEAMARHNLGLCLARLGRFEEAEREERVAAESLEQQGDRRLASFAYAYRAEIARLAGRLDDARRHSGRAVAISEGVKGPRAFALTTAAAAELDSGDARSALEKVRDALAMVESGGPSEDGEALMRWVNARALEAMGDIEGARTCIAYAAQRLQARMMRLPDDAARGRFLQGVWEHAATMAMAERLGAG